MSNPSNEPGLGKNYFAALILSFLILIGYPYILNWLHPKPEITPEITEQVSPQSSAPREVEAKPDMPPAQGTSYLEPPSPPALTPFENRLFEAEFSTLGGSILRLVYKGEAARNGIDRTRFYDGAPTAPGLFGVRLLHEAADLTRSIFKLNRAGDHGEIFEFIHEREGEYRLAKRFTLSEETPVIDLEVAVENLSPRTKHFPLELEYGLDYEFTHGLTAHNFEALALTDKAESANLDRISKKGYQISKPAAWTGVLKKYFSILVKPDWKSVAFDARSDEKTLWATATMEPLTLAPGEKVSHQILIYAGPQRYETLKSLELGFEGILSRGFFGAFKIWLLIALKFFDQYTHNFGWAIIILTLILKGVFTPLTHMSFENMKKMQVLQPKLKALQERYKKEPQKLQHETMQLYKRNRVNPMTGCLPVALQIPVFIAFYQALAEAIELKGAPFLGWIRDLSEPDRLISFPFTVPLVGWDALNILPLLMIASQFWQQKLTPSSGGMPPEQAKMMELMPVIFGFMFYNMPSGLVLYWFVNNMLSIIHQVFVKRMVIVLHHEDQDS